MQAVRTIMGRAMPLDRSDVDTDQIIPAEWLKRVERTGFGAGLFGAWRQDPDFVLNRPEYQGAVVLVAGANFGCGSSREHAPWALEDWGFRAVVAPSFADIFKGNCLKIGLVPVEIPADQVEKLMRAIEADPAAVVTVDVETRLVACDDADVRVPFPLDDFTQHRLLNGLDDIGLTLRHLDEITAFEETRAPWLPSIST